MKITISTVPGSPHEIFFEDSDEKYAVRLCDANGHQFTIYPRDMIDIMMVKCEKDNRWLPLDSPQNIQPSSDLDD